LGVGLGRIRHRSRVPQSICLPPQWKRWSSRSTSWSWSDTHFYHLNLCLAPLSPDALLIYPGAFAPETLARIRSWTHTLEVSREEALQFVCNGVSVNGYYITPRLTRHLEHILGSEGIEPIVVDLSEFQKAGGSAASLKMLLP